MWLHNQLDVEGNDLLVEMCVASRWASCPRNRMWSVERPAGERSPDRVHRRNGYRTRDGNPGWARSSCGHLKLRQGSYFPEWLLNARTRSERAFVQVGADAHVRGVSTRKVEGLVESLGVTSLSKSQVSELARELDQTAFEFRNRPSMPTRTRMCGLARWWSKAVRAAGW